MAKKVIDTKPPVVDPVPVFVRIVFVFFGEKIKKEVSRFCPVRVAVLL
jgi:hypothetical protein